MYYVISASHPEQDNATGLVAHLRQSCPLFNERRGDAGAIHELQVDKAQFKIGSLDQLMVLNETCQKLDSQLENVCKKIEKVAIETMPDQNQELLYNQVSASSKRDPSKSSISTSQTTVILTFPAYS